MPHRCEKSLTEARYDRMASDLDAMAEALRLRPEMNQYFAERLALLAKEIREGPLEAHPHVRKFAPPEISN
jgi:hypothetical protein